MSKTMPKSKEANFLEGFQIVESDAQPIITLDKQQRFYINATARRLMGVKPYERLAIAYNMSTKAIAIVRPNAPLDSAQASLLATSQYNIDKRFYMYARHFARACGYDSARAPYHFVYERGASDGSAFIFRLLSDD